ncbi:MAG: PAS domain S-box protein [Deltaproteobacteria bacterium]|nr:PAS domain S-box protein [Deltaproteobacteria bacterium]
MTTQSRSADRDRKPPAEPPEKARSSSDDLLAANRALEAQIARLKQSERIITAQRDLGFQLAAASSASEALRLSLETAIRLSDLDCGGIYLLDSFSNTFRLICVTGVSETFADQVREASDDSEWVRMARLNRPAYFDLESFRAEEYLYCRKEGLTAAAMIPFSDRERAIGILNIASHRRDGIPPESRDALENIAPQIGAAVLRAQADDALRASERRFRDLTDLLPQPVFECDARGNLTFANRTTSEVFGYSIADLGRGDRSIDRVFLPEERGRIVTVLETLKEGRKIGPLEFTFRRKDGSTFPAIVYAGPILRDNRVTGFRGTLTDITERRQAECVLRESESKFRHLAENSVAGIYLIQDGVFQYVNGRFAETLGFTVEELAGAPVETLIFPDDWPLVRANLRKRIEGTLESLHYEFRGRKKSGEVRRVEVYSSRTLYRGNPAVIGTLLDVTDRRQAEEALRQSEARLRQVIDLVPHYIFAKDLAGRFILVNRTVAEAYGTTVEELTGKTDADFSPDPTEVDHFRKDDLAVINSGVPLEIPEESMTDAQGRTRILRTVKIPFTLSGQQVKATLGVSTDITEQKRAQTALQESEAKYRNIFENAIEGIFQTTPEGRFISVNPALAQMAGYASPQEMLSAVNDIGRQVYRHPQERIRLLSRLQEAGAVEKFETELCRKDGSLIWTTINARMVRDGQGTLVYYEGAVQDITRRRQAEQALLESEAKYRSVVENSLVGFYIIQDGLLRFVNQHFCDVTGYAYEEIVDLMSPLEMIHPDDRPLAAENMTRRLIGQEPQIEYSFRVLRKDGRIVTVKVLGALITYRERMALCGTAIDITYERSMEAQLHQAQKMEAIGTLAGGIAHDFNNILGGIVGYAGLAQLKTCDGPIKPYLEQILRACDRAKDLVTQILTFSRQRDLEKKPLSVTPVVKEALKLLRSSLPATIEIRLHQENIPDTILANATQIHQVLINLCANAAHAMRERGGVLDIALSRLDITGERSADGPLAQGPYLQLVVRDTGHGIDPAVLDRIFDPFYTTKGPGEGTGLGLSMVYGIVKNHGGAVSVASRPGEGTAFTICLPLLDSEGKPPEGEREEIPGGQGCILLVDDEELLASLGKEMLSFLGYEVTVRFSSLDALEAFRANPGRFDLVITDMTMPNMTGSELAKELLRIRPELPVIITSGFSERMNGEEAARIGVREFIMKPLSLARLARAVNGVLGPQQATGDGAGRKAQ